MSSFKKSNRGEAVAVCIPTRGREKWLKRLLYSIERQNFDKEVIVVVSDNDVINRVGTKVVEELRQEGYRWDIQVVFAPKPCMSCAWNTVFNYACNLDVEYLAMIDDDEVATEFWLHSLLNAMKHLYVDVLGGTVIQCKKNNVPLPDHYFDFVAPHNARNLRGIMFYSTSTPSLGSGNFMIRRSVMAQYLPEPTSAKFDEFGGGDTDIFLKLLDGGYKFGFSEEAIAWEEVSAEREGLRQNINYMISFGQRRAAIDLNEKKTAYRIIRSLMALSVKAFINSSIFMFYLVFRFNVKLKFLAHWIILFAYICFFLGFRSKFYIKDSHTNQ